jgi:transcriptional regulator with XRE-family HTH domain
VSELSDLRGKLARSKAYREAFAASALKRLLPAQIRVLRRQRKWSQADLAKESRLTQGVISRAEDPEYGNLTVNTLVRVASGFDCAYIGRFVPFSELGRWYSMLSDERQLEVQSFDADHGFIDHKEMGTASIASVSMSGALSLAAVQVPSVSAGVLSMTASQSKSLRSDHLHRGNVICLPSRHKAANTRSYQHVGRKKRTATATTAVTA